MTDLRAVLLACLLAGPAVAADPAPLFSDHTVLDVRIEAPIKVLMEVRPDESYLKGTFVFTDLDGVELIDTSPYERAKAGLFLIMQYPTEVPGVRVPDNDPRRR